MKKGFVVSAVLYPLLVMFLVLVMGILAMGQNRRKILDNMKLEVSEESETDPEMSNSALYYKMKALEEAYAEMSSRLSEERFEEIDDKISTSKNQAISAAKLQAFPIGSIFISTSSTNPSSYIGGTWVAYGQGRTLVGVGSNGTSSYSAGATGGSETHNHSGTIGATTLTASQIPSHTHSIPALSGTTNTAGDHTHGIGSRGSGSNIAASGNAIGAEMLGSNLYTQFKTNSTGAHAHSVTTVASTTGSIGDGGSHTHTLTVNSSSNHSPYIVVYFWKRTV